MSVQNDNPDNQARSSFDRRAMFTLFAIALGLRILYASILATQPDIQPESTTPALNYATEIASGFDWIRQPFSPQSPGYPVTLAILLLISAKQLWLVAVLQAMIGALTVLVVYSIGTRLLDRGLAMIAALWMALNVHHMHFASAFHRDILTVFLLALVVLLLVRPFERMRLALVAALAYTALIHVDPQFLLLAPLFCIFILLRTGHRILNVQYLFVFVTAVLLLSAPWALRNQAVYGQPLPIGLEAYRYLRPLKVAVSDVDRAMSGIERRVGEVSGSDRFQRNSVEFWRFARLKDQEVPKQSDETVARSGESAWSFRHNLISISTFGLLLPFFVVGTFVVFRNRDRLGIMLTVTSLGYFLARSYLGGSERDRMPIEPLIILIAFYGVAALSRRKPPGHHPPAKT